MTTTIYGREIAPKIGSVIRFDGSPIGKRLLAGDEAFGSWQGCQFRFPNPVPGWEESHAIACNVTVTGRTLKAWGGFHWVRVRIEWVGHCEPSTFVSGWMMV